MYPDILFDECSPYTSKEMELNATSNQEWEGRMDGQGKSLMFPLHYRGGGMKNKKVKRKNEGTVLLLSLTSTL